jgi:hypothetical protein
VRTVEKPGPNRSGFAIASFVLSLVGFFIFLIFLAAIGYNADDAVTGFLALFMLIIDLIGIVFGSLSFKSSSLKGMAIAGFVIAVVPVCLVFVLLMLGLFVGA